MSPKNKTACLIIIGNEILSGRTKDENLPHLATELNEIGVQLAEARVIPDVEETIVATVNECRAAFDYVFTTGGIGPTHDDITSECVAKAFGVEYELNADAHAILKAHYKKPGDLNEARLRMARMPAGAELVENPVSKAPGYRLENVYVMAGVPIIMRSMFASIRHQLAGGKPMLSRTIGGHVAEGQIAAPLGEIQNRHPEIEIGSYPFFRGGTFGCSLVLRSTDEAELEATAEEVRQMIRDLGQEPHDGEIHPKQGGGGS